MIPAEDIRPATRTVKLVSGAFVDLHLTGLYLPPGQEITLKVLQEKAPAKAKWKVCLLQAFCQSKGSSLGSGGFEASAGSE